MKFKKLALLGFACLFAAGGVSAAFAMKYTAANKEYSANTDGAVILHWDETNVVDNVTSLTSTNYVYRMVVLEAPSSTHTSDQTGNARLTFNLAGVEAENKTLTGVKVNVYKGSTIAAVQAANTENNQKKTPRGMDPTFSVVVGTDSTNDVAITTATDTNFVLEFDYDGTPQAEGKTLGGQLSIALSYVAA